MFLPNAFLTVRSPKGFNVYGKADYAAPRVVACCVLRLKHKDENTPVRTDSSASRAFAKEPVADARFMVGPKSGVSKKDRVSFAGADYEVIAAHVRLDVHGREDHIEIEAASWQG